MDVGDSGKLQVSSFITPVGLLLSLVVAFGASSAWRGSWMIMDALLLPEKPLASDALTAGIGPALFLLLAAVQPFLAAWVGRSRELRWAGPCADLAFSYLGFWSCSMTWRGVWYLWDHASGFGRPAKPIDWEFARAGIFLQVVG